jgi:hypothetical protein
VAAGLCTVAPVRIGNAASLPFQLDVFGEILGAFYHGRATGLEETEAGVELGQSLLTFVESHGSNPIGNLGGPWPAPALQPFEGHGLGRLRPCSQGRRAFRRSRTRGSLARDPRRHPMSRCAAPGLGDRRGADAPLRPGSALKPLPSGSGVLQHGRQAG